VVSVANKVGGDTGGRVDVGAGVNVIVGWRIELQPGRTKQPIRKQISLRESIAGFVVIRGLLKSSLHAHFTSVMSRVI
jgi:hypothetical protein